MKAKQGLKNKLQLGTTPVMVPNKLILGGAEKFGGGGEKTERLFFCFKKNEG